MFDRLTMNPAVIDLAQWAKQGGVEVKAPFFGRLIIIETDWVHEDEKADWEFPSREIVTVGMMTFGNTTDAARYLEETQGRNKGVDWFQFLSSASRAALEWHNSPEQQG